MQLRNEWNKTPLLFKFFNFVFLVLLWLCDFAVLGLRPWRAQKALLGILRRVLGRGREIPHSPQLAHKSSITPATHSSLITQGKRQVKDSRRLGMSQSCSREFEQFCRSCSGVESRRRCQHLTNTFGGMGTLEIDWAIMMTMQQSLKSTLHLTGSKRSNARVSR